MGLCGQHGFLASSLATMHKFMINYHSEFYYQQSQLNYCARRRTQNGKFLVLWHQCSSGNSSSKGTVGNVSVGGRKPHAAVLLVLCHALYLSELTYRVLFLQQHQFSGCEWKVSSPNAAAQQHISIRFLQKRLFRLLSEHIHDFLHVNWSLSRCWVVFLKNILFDPTAMKLRAMGLL